VRLLGPPGAVSGSTLLATRNSPRAFRVMAKTTRVSGNLDGEDRFLASAVSRPYASKVGRSSAVWNRQKPWRPRDHENAQTMGSASRVFSPNPQHGLQATEKSAGYGLETLVTSAFYHLQELARSYRFTSLCRV
jgi:hypothetical protein